MFIIPSGKPKIWDQSPEAKSVIADQAYTGTFHKLCKQYVESFDEPYRILSPKFGFLKKEDIVPYPYDVRFTMKGTNHDTIQLDDLKKQWKNLNPKDEVVVLGGKKYKVLMQQLASNNHKNFHYPLVGLGGIGFMQQALKEAIRKQTTL